MLSESDIRSAKLVEVLQIAENVGAGTEADPARLVISYYTKDGDLIAALDPLDDKEDD